jgi:dienelactone hydrolase
VVVAVVLLALSAAMVPGTHALAATSCTDGPAAGVPVAGSEGVTRTDFTVAHRVEGSCRTVVTQVRTPTSTATAPRPVILALHGRDGSPDSLAPLLDAWVAAGYVVVAPKLPETKKDEQGKALRSEVLLQAADARHVLDQVLDRAAEFDIDPDAVGAAGMSLGGLTVYALISHTCCEDGRIHAAVVMSGVHDPLPSGRYEHQDVPVLLLHGDADTGYRHSRAAYAQLAPPKWFVTLHGEKHAPPFEVPRSSISTVVDVTTTSFWNRYLRDDTAAAAKIVSAVSGTDGKATLQRDLKPR